MTAQPLVPAREDIMVIIDSLEALSDKIQDEIDEARSHYYLAPEPTIDDSLNMVVLAAHLEQVALVRGRMQPYLEEILEESPFTARRVVR